MYPLSNFVWRGYKNKGEKHKNLRPSKSPCYKRVGYIQALNYEVTLYGIPIVPQKISIGLSASITFLPSKFCIHFCINHSKGAWNSVFIGKSVGVSFLSKLGWKGLMTCLTKIIISLRLLNQIGWGFRRDADN